MHALRRTLPLVVVLALGASGCFTPYLKRAADAPDPKPSEALVGGFMVRFQDSGQNRDLLAAAVNAAQNAGLAEFGQKATTLHAEALAQWGYTVKYDGARATKLDLLQIESGAATSALTGTWRHPEASSWGPQMVESLFVKPVDIVGKLKDDAQKEYFVFTEITIQERGFVLKEPAVFVRTAIFDAGGRKVLDLAAVGAGNSSFLLADRSPPNLERALDAAFKGLAAVKEETL
jgi:hypothetical protein